MSIDALRHDDPDCPVGTFVLCYCADSGTCEPVPGLSPEIVIRELGLSMQCILREAMMEEAFQVRGNSLAPDLCGDVRIKCLLEPDFSPYDCKDVYTDVRELMRELLCQLQESGKKRSLVYRDHDTFLLMGDATPAGGTEKMPAPPSRPWAILQSLLRSFALLGSYLQRQK